MNYSKQIIKYIEEFLDKNPNLTFCQALKLLKINESDNSHNTDLEGNYLLRDNFYDTDGDVLKRIEYSEQIQKNPFTKNLE